MTFPALFFSNAKSDGDDEGGHRGVGGRAYSLDDGRAAGSGDGGVLPHRGGEEVHDGGVSSCAQGSCEPLAQVHEDARGGGSCGGSSADGLRDVSGDLERCEGALQPLAELPERAPGALMGVSDDGGVRISLRLRGVSRRLGSPEREADPEDVGITGSRRCSTRGATVHGGVEDAVGRDVVVDVEIPHHHPHRGSYDSTPRRRPGDTFLRGPAGQAGDASRSLSSLGAESGGGASRAGLRNGAASAGADADGVPERRELGFGVGGGEQSTGGGRGGRRTGSGRQPNSVKMADMAARSKEMEAEIEDLKAQLFRKESDKLQWMQAEWSATQVQLQMQLEMEREQFSRARRNCAAATTAMEQAEVRRDVALQRAEAAEASLEQSQVDCVRLQREAATLARKLASRDKMVERRDVKVASLPELQHELAEATSALEVLRPRVSELEEEVSRKDSQLQVAEGKLADRLTTIRKYVGKQGGRPVVNRGDEELDDCGPSQASQCESRMTLRVLDVIGEVGVVGCVSSEALMDALVLGGWMETVFESRASWERRMRWMEELGDDLRSIWDAKLTLQLKDKLLVSYDKLDELRTKLSHHRVSNRLVPRVWFINPWTGERVHFPQPIASRYAWTPLVKAAEKRYGLKISGDGKVASRSFVGTLRQAHARDSARGLLRPISEEDPFVCVLGADATGVGKVGLTHVALSVAPSYREGIAVQNELNINTIATSRTDDHWEGLNEVLCAGYYQGKVDELPPTCIAAEIDAIVVAGSMETTAGKCVCVRAHGCFDLVAARGVRGGRGRCACHCECETEADRWSCPEVAEEDGDWETVKPLLLKHKLLDNSTMRNDSHTPPADWDFEAQGPWYCEREGCDVKFVSWEDWRARVKAYFEIKGNKSSDGKKAQAKRAKQYAKLHPSGQGEHMCPLTMLAMLFIIIDPLHCLMLNLPKVIWKYSFGDRMTNDQRELVAQYLTDIGLPLDVRNKNDGRDANKKWFSGADFQKFCEGTGPADNPGPGLGEHIKAIMDIIYYKCPAPDADADEQLPAAAPPAATPAATPVPMPAVNKTALNGGGGSKKRRGGFSMAPPPPPATTTTTIPPAAEATPAPAPKPVPKPAPANTDTPLQAKLRERYKSHMDAAHLGVSTWNVFGRLYAEWRKPWTSRTKEYAAQRAYSFLLLAVELSPAIKALSAGKCKSWYIHLVVWVVPLQMWLFGDLWAYGTSPVEQRGARLKRICRSVVCWRAYHDGWEPPVKPGDPRVWNKKRKYESCAMMQLMRTCCANEEMWEEGALVADSACLSRSERRMQKTGRTTLLKIERGNGSRLETLTEEVIDLTWDD